MNGAELRLLTFLMPTFLQSLMQDMQDRHLKSIILEGVDCLLCRCTNFSWLKALIVMLIEDPGAFSLPELSFLVLVSDLLSALCQLLASCTLSPALGYDFVKFQYILLCRKNIKREEDEIRMRLSFLNCL